MRATEGSVGGELAVRLMRLVPEEGVRKQGRQGLGRVKKVGLGAGRAEEAVSVSADVERGCPSVEGT